jgi:hypothetical protein
VRFRDVAAIAAVLLAAPNVRAEDARTSSLSWLRMPGAEACIATQPLARAVEERIGREVFVSAAQADLSVEGRIEKRPDGGFRAIITMRDPAGSLLGTRELERPDASCDAMSEPLALVIAVMIDPDAAMRPKDAVPPPGPPGPPPPSPSPQAPPAVGATDRAPAPPPLRPKEPWRFEGGAHAMTVAGLAPEVAWGAGVNAILFPPGLPVGFRGMASLFLPTRAAGDGTVADFDMLVLGGSVCPTLRRRVSLMACIGGHLGALRPRPRGPGTTTLPDDLIGIWNASAELRVSVPVAAPIAVGAGAGGAVPITRPSYGGIYESAIVAFTADVGVGVYFP